MADNSNGKTERWVKWAVGLCLGLLGYTLTSIVTITNDYTAFKTETRFKLDGQNREQIEVNKRVAETMERSVQQHEALIRLLEYVDRDLNGAQARVRTFDK